MCARLVEVEAIRRENRLVLLDRDRLAAPLSAAHDAGRALAERVAKYNLVGLHLREGEGGGWCARACVAGLGAPALHTRHLAG